MLIIDELLAEGQQCPEAGQRSFGCCYLTSPRSLKI